MYDFYLKKIIQPPCCVSKILLMMKLTTLLLIVSILQVSAGSFAQKITIVEKDAPLLQVLNQIKSQTGYDFVFNASILKDAKPVSLDLKQTDLKVVLNAIFKNQPLVFSIENNLVVISKKEPSFLENLVDRFQQIDVRGKIVDEKGMGLPGASIKVKGSNQMTTSSQNGDFYLQNVNENAVLTISFVGYAVKEVMAAKDLGNISLETSSSKLEEVNVTVNTGYQNLSKERSAGSFAKPNLDILKNRSGSTSILQRLDGLVPGLTVNNAPSASDNPFLVRGLSTIGASTSGRGALTNRNPLYVVDGIPLDDVSTINPQDVADITVLRDATAASIWGARATNGVIVITTKRGYASDQVKIQYDGYVNFQGRPDFNYIPTLNSKQFIQAAGEVFDPVVYRWADVSAYPTYNYGVPPHERILYNQSRGLISAAQAKSSLDSLGNLNNVDQIKALWYRPALQTNHTASLSGGTNTYTFYVSGAYTGIKSNRPGDVNNTFKINGRQDLKLGSRVQLNLITDLTNAITANKGKIDIDNRFLPYQLFQDAAGNNLSMPYLQNLTDETRIDYQNLSRINLDYNPLDEYNYNTSKSNTFLSRNVLGLGVKLIKGLRFEGTYSYLRGTSRGEQYNDLKSYGVRSEIVQFTVAPDVNTTPLYSLPTNGGTFAVNQTLQRNWTLRNQLVYDRDWNDKQHQLTLLGGQEAQGQFTLLNGSKVRGYNPLLQTFGAIDYATLGSSGLDNPVWTNGSFNSMLSNDGFSQDELQTRFTSYYANAGYTYQRKYSLNASLRFDRSNLFGLDQAAQNRPVYSVGAKWQMAGEHFLKNSSFLDQLDLRATYGITGNSPSPGTASSYDVITAQQSPFYPGGNGVYISTASNPHLSWERTENMNLGLDFGFWDRRLTGSLDFYRKNTSNLIGSLPTNGFTGYSTIVGNVGDMQNKGFELSLTAVNIRNSDFSWNTQLILSYNKNRITRFNLFAPITNGSGLISQNYLEGYPAFGIFAYQYAGLDNMGDPQVKLADGTITKTPKITKPQDMKFMGTYQPVWNGGLSNIFGYKNWILSINTVFNFGNVMRRDVNQFYTGRLAGAEAGIFTLGNVNAEFADRWKSPGDEANTNIPAYVSNSSLSKSRRDVTYYTNADINVVNAAYVKMRDATLSYRINSSLLKKINVDQLTIRTQVSNVMLWKANHYGIDPEFQYAPTGNRTLIANQGTITFGLNVQF